MCGILVDRSFTYSFKLSVLSLEYVHDAAFQQLKEYRMRGQKAEEMVDYIYLGRLHRRYTANLRFSGLLQGLERTWTTYGGCQGI